MNIEIKIENYLNMISEQASEKENRPNDVQWQFSIYNDYVFLAVRTDYQKVLMHILYRLTQNFDKNIKGYHLKLIPVGKVQTNWLNRQPNKSVCGFNAWSLERGIDFTHSFAEWNLFGRKVTLRTFTDKNLLPPDVNQQGSKVVNKHLQNFIEVSRNPLYDVQVKSWQNYERKFKKIYGHAPVILKTIHTNF